MRILLTGGAGYIGSHTLLQLLQQQHELCVIDNFSNAAPEALSRVARLSNRHFEHHDATILDSGRLDEIFDSFQPQAVIHFAGLKAVGESDLKPLSYYEENVFGTIQLLKAMDRAKCRRIVFSSSATVYGTPHYLPYDEAHPLAPINPYGRTKYFIEEILKDWAKTDADKAVMLLRYFNPVGAHPSGAIGEDPMGVPNNLMPFIAQVAIGRRPVLNVFGNDYDTPDGTGVRDYIHVDDLARGHAAALDYITHHTGVEAVNLGAGKGISVLEMVKAFEQASGVSIPLHFAPRRPGDLPQFWADATKAKTLFNWEVEKSLVEMCADVWRWQSQNPHGYGDETGS